MNPDPSDTQPPGDDAVVRIGSGQFDWPLPRKEVVVGGRAFSLEVLLVAGLYAVTGIWLAWSIRDIIPFIPDAISGLFGNSFEFAFSWLILMVVGMIGYCIVALLYTAFRIFRCDPVGRGLSVVIAAILLLLCFAISSQGVSVPGSIVVIALVACTCSALLFVSPWVRLAMSVSGRRLDRPAPVVVSLTVTVSFFSLVGGLGILLMPGLRFAGDLGAKFVLFELFSLIASGLALVGYVRLRPGPNRSGRVLLSAAAGVVLLGYLISGQGSSIALGLGIAASVAGPLWLMPSARTWFGDQPINLNMAPPGAPTAGAAPPPPSTPPPPPSPPPYG